MHSAFEAQNKSAGEGRYIPTHSVLLSSHQVRIKITDQPSEGSQVSLLLRDCGQRGNLSRRVGGLTSPIYPDRLGKIVHNGAVASYVKPTL